MYIYITPLQTAGGTEDASAIARYSVACFHFSAAFVLAASSCAHLFAPLLPFRQNKQLWHIDYSAIVVSIGGSYVPGLMFGFRCHRTWRNLYFGTVIAGLAAGFAMTLADGIAPRTNGSRTFLDRLRIAVLTFVVAFGLVPLGE